MQLNFCVFFSAAFVTMTASEWVQIPVLDPNRHTHSDIPLSVFKIDALATNSEKPSSPVFSPSLVIQNVSEDQSKNELDKPGTITKTPSTIGDKNRFVNITVLNEEQRNEINGDFLQSIMNNSQKIDKMGEAKNNHANSKKKSLIETLTSAYRTLLQDVPSTLTGKMNFLQNLKAKIYSYMKPHIRRIWGMQDRQARTGDKMSFPSMDGALMTISLLLFAVYLIKLVQQLIQKLQDKANMQAMMMTGVTPTALNIKGRRKRDASAEINRVANVLQLIETFRKKYQMQD